MVSNTARSLLLASSRVETIEHRAHPHVSCAEVTGALQSTIAYYDMITLPAGAD